jgi:hypothetical protein
VIRPIRLKFYHGPSGCEIHADIPNSVNCLEFSLAPGLQPVVKPSERQHLQSQLLGYEPWIQFPPAEWTQMLETIFQEMVDAWNKTYSKDAKITVATPRNNNETATKA